MCRQGRVQLEQANGLLVQFNKEAERTISYSSLKQKILQLPWFGTIHKSKQFKIITNSCLQYNMICFINYYSCYTYIFALSILTVVIPTEHICLINSYSCYTYRFGLSILIVVIPTYLPYQFLQLLYLQICLINSYSCYTYRFAVSIIIVVIPTDLPYQFL